MNKHTISTRGLDFIKGFESFVPYVYDDKRPPVSGMYREWHGEPVKGTLTIGYGHTNAARHPLKIVRSLKITKAEGLKILDVDLDECEEAVNNLVKVTLTQGQFDALVSFAFNCGVGNLKKLIVPLNHGDYAQTRTNFDHYVRSGGEVMKGLVRRRDGEQAMWDARYDDVVVPTVALDIPKKVDTPQPATPMTQSNIGNGSIVAGLGTTALAAKAATDAAKDTADNLQAIISMVTSPWVILAVGVIGVLGFIWYKRYRLKQDAGV